MNTQDHTENYLNILAFFSNNHQEISKTVDEEAKFLYQAHFDILSAKCYKAISRKKIEKIKEQIQQQLNSKIKQLELQQKAGFDAGLLIIKTKEQEEINELQEKIKYLENLTDEELTGIITEIIISKIDFNLIQILENELACKKLEKFSRLTYNNKPCTKNDEIDYVVVEQICKYIEDNDLLKITERINKSLFINKTFQELALLKRNREEIINTMYLEIYEEKIEKLNIEIKEELDNLSLSKYSDSIINDNIYTSITNLESLRQIVQLKLEKQKLKIFHKKIDKLKNLLSLINETIKYQSEAEKYEWSLGDFDFTEDMKKAYEKLEISKIVKELKQDIVNSTGAILRNIELEKEDIINKFTKELDKKTREENDKITEIASQSEIDKAKEFNLKIDENDSIEKILKFLEGEDKILNWLFISLFSEELNKQIEYNNQGEICQQILERIEPGYDPTILDKSINKQLGMSTSIEKKLPSRLGVKPNTNGYPSAHQKVLKIPNNKR